MLNHEQCSNCLRERLGFLLAEPSVHEIACDAGESATPALDRLRLVLSLPLIPLGCALGLRARTATER